MTENNYDSLLLEDLLDDIELSDAPKKTAAQKLAADLSDDESENERPNYPNFIKLVFKQYIRIAGYHSGTIHIEKNLIKSAKQLQLVFDSGFFFDNCYLEFILGDLEDEDETIEYDSDKMILLHRKGESVGRFIVRVWYDKSRLRYRKLNRFFNCIFGIQDNEQEFWIEYIKVPVVRGSEEYSYGVRNWQQFSVDKWYIINHRPTNTSEYLNMLCGTIQELIPTGEVNKFLKSLDGSDDVWSRIAALITQRYAERKHNNGGFYLLSGKHHQISDNVRNYKFMKTYAINPANATGCFILKSDGTLQKNKSDQPKIDKKEFTNALKAYLDRDDITFNIYENRGSYYMTYLIFDQPMILNGLEYIIMFECSCSSKSATYQVAQTIKPITFSGVSDETAMRHFIDQSPLDYSNKWQMDVLDCMRELDGPQ